LLDDWPSLFPEEQDNFNGGKMIQSVPMDHVPSDDNGTFVNPQAIMGGTTGEMSPPAIGGVAPSRQYSTDSNSPSRSPKSAEMKKTSSKRHSLSGGISRRKPSADLKPVIWDPANPVDIKRARNTLAARKSRARRVERMDELAQTVEELEKEKEALASQMEYYKNLARQHGALVD